MNEQPRTRQELYDRIRRTSKEEFILEEMIRLGFWPARSNKPDDPANEIHRKAEILKELRSLQSEAYRLQDERAMRQAALKARMAASRQKRIETRERNARLRAERAAAWKLKKSRDILFLGEEVSGGLSGKGMDEARLRAAGLPLLSDAADLAKAMGITVGLLRFLAWNRRVSSVSHYIRFRVPKKTGGERRISAPMPRLKKAQRWVLTNILEKVPVHGAAHGFVSGRSIVSNAQQHVGQEVVVNLDLQDFFPSIHWRRVKGLFRSFGYGDQVATLLALLCSETEVAELELDGKRWFVALSDRRLPQGSPASPILSNLLCRNLDTRLTAFAESLGFRYTRYADDLSFSGSGPSTEKVGKLIKETNWIVVDEGFAVHPEKTGIQRKGRQQEVTGLVVNERVGVPRETLRRFRAVLHQIETQGPAEKRWGQGELWSSLAGFASFVAMVDPAKGIPLQEKVTELRKKYGVTVVTTPPAAPPPSVEAPPTAPSPTAAPPAPQPEPPPPEPPKKPWWKLF